MLEKDFILRLKKFNKTLLWNVWLHNRTHLVKLFESSLWNDFNECHNYYMPLCGGIQIGWKTHNRTDNLWHWPCMPGFHAVGSLPHFWHEISSAHLLWATGGTQSISSGRHRRDGHTGASWTAYPLTASSCQSRCSVSPMCWSVCTRRKIRAPDKMRKSNFKLTLLALFLHQLL